VHNPNTIFNWTNIDITPSSMFGVAKNNNVVLANRTLAISFSNITKRPATDQNITITGASITGNITLTTNTIETFIPNNGSGGGGSGTSLISCISIIGNGCGATFTNGCAAIT